MEAEVYQMGATNEKEAALNAVDVVWISVPRHGLQNCSENITTKHSVEHQHQFELATPHLDHSV